MQNLFIKIEALDNKMRQVLQKMNLLKKENRALLEENIKLKKELEHKSAIEQNNANIVEQKLVPVEVMDLQGSEHINFVKEEIDKYVAEIDDCIGMLKPNR